MQTRFFAAVLSASMAWAELGSAQGPQQITERPNAFESLADSQWVRVTVSEVGRRQGRLLERSSEHVVLSAEPQPLRVPATTIDTLWTRGTAWKTGGIVGGLTGLAFGILFGVGVSQIACEGGDCSSTGAAVGGGALGLTAGALLGAGVGSVIHKWNRRYPSAQ